MIANRGIQRLTAIAQINGCLGLVKLIAPVLNKIRPAVIPLSSQLGRESMRQIINPAVIETKNVMIGFTLLSYSNEVIIPFVDFR
jgi:hypothetical protein